MKTLYTARATSTHGRAGHAQTDDGKISVDLSPPGSNGKGTNPEQLFACGYAACFGGAVEFVAKQQKLDIGEANIAIEVSLHQDEQTGFSLSAVLDVSLPKLDAAAAQKLVEAAHQTCPYSKATRGNIPVTLKVNSQELSKAA